jgi:hypothetical protein
VEVAVNAASVVMEVAAWVVSESAPYYDDNDDDGGNDDNDYAL